MSMSIGKNHYVLTHLDVIVRKQTSDVGGGPIIRNDASEASVAKRKPLYPPNFLIKVKQGIDTEAFQPTFPHLRQQSTGKLDIEPSACHPT